jgi:hypothetical protein
MPNCTGGAPIVTEKERIGCATGALWAAVLSLPFWVLFAWMVWEVLK